MTDCPKCGVYIKTMIWDEEAEYWTGKCSTCGTIVNATKDEVVHL